MTLVVSERRGPTQGQIVLRKLLELQCHRQLLLRFDNMRDDVVPIQ
jgi:hypothetical protein